MRKTMIPFCLLISLLFGFQLTMVGQGKDGGVVIGKVVDPQGVPIPYANTLLYNSDSVRIAGDATDTLGNFRIEAPPGAYYLQISFLSYLDTLVSGIELGKAPVSLGKIALVAEDVEMETVDIEAERPQMQLKLDKRVFNVNADPNMRGRNTAEILDNLPSVEVDVEGNVSLRGSQNVRILIDGKPSGLVGTGSPDALRLLQGDQVERIEVITNPSARYDAEGEAGIINIVLKKEKKKGVNGTFSATAGWPHNYGLGASLNYRKKKVNFFAGYGLNFRQRPGSGTQTTYFLDTTAGSFDTISYYERDRSHYRGGLSHNVRGGMDLFINKRNTITASGLYSTSDGSNEADLEYRFFDSTGTLFQTNTRHEDEAEPSQDIEFGLSHRKTFAQKGRQWTSDFKFIQSEELEKADLTEVSTNPDFSPVTQRSSNTENEYNWLGQSDYVHPFGKEGAFEAGVRGTFRIIDNEFRVDNFLNSEWVTDAFYDNHLRYNENIYAGYAMAGNKTGKFSYQIGLRAEYSDIKTNLLRTNDVNHRKYLNWFPSGHFSYEFSDQQYVQLSYSRRITRPRFRHLLPFFGFSDPRSFYSGNPDLNPELTHSMELGYLKYADKGSFLTSVYYRRTDNVVQRTSFSDSVGFTYTFPINLGTKDAVGMEANASWKIKKWWSVNGNVNIYYAIIQGMYEEQDFYAETFTGNAQLGSKWTIAKKVFLQATYRYRAPVNTPQGRRLDMHVLDLGASTDILKGNGTLTLSARDVFNSRKRRSETFGTTFYAEDVFQWRARQFLLTFTYRLNQKKKREREGRGRNGGFGDSDLD